MNDNLFLIRKIKIKQYSWIPQTLMWPNPKSRAEEQKAEVWPSSRWTQAKGKKDQGSSFPSQHCTLELRPTGHQTTKSSSLKEPPEPALTREARLVSAQWGWQEGQGHSQGNQASPVFPKNHQPGPTQHPYEQICFSSSPYSERKNRHSGHPATAIPCQRGLLTLSPCCLQTRLPPFCV